MGQGRARVWAGGGKARPRPGQGTRAAPASHGRGFAVIERWGRFPFGGGHGSNLALGWVVGCRSRGVTGAPGRAGARQAATRWDRARSSGRCTLGLLNFAAPGPGGAGCC